MFIIEMVDTVSVIPENTEIFCCRFQSGKSLYCLCRVGDTLWIGILRHTPDTLDGRIRTYQLLYHIHIRTCRGHRHVDHFNAEILCDPEMTGHIREQDIRILLCPACTMECCRRHRGSWNGKLYQTLRSDWNFRK